MISISASAQTALDQKVSGRFSNKTLLEIFQDLERQTDLRFYFDPEKLPYYKLNITFEADRLYEAMQELTVGKGLVFSVFEEDKLVITRRGDLNKAYAEELIRRWENDEITIPMLYEPQEVTLQIGQSTSSDPGQPLTFSGTILDAETKEPIIGATLTTDDGTGIATDAFGNFQLKLPFGKQELDVRYIGYQPILLHLKLYESGMAELNMQASALRLDEVVVRAQMADRNVRSAEMGVESLTPQMIKELPSFLGEADVIQSLKMLPGVSTVGEGATGFNVRGGSIDQNLIVQDEGLVFNSSHVLGFFSTFNPDVVSDVTLYKGHIPAQYGGRLSSVLDVQLKDGNFQKFTGNGGLGLVSSRLTLEGPLRKDKTSLLAGGRISYSDWILRRVRLPDARQSSAYFYDILGKATHRFNSGSTLTLSYYNSYDFFRFAQDFGFTWRTQLTNLNWKQIWSDRLSSSFSAIAGRYDSSQFDPADVDAFTLNNGLRYYKLKHNFFYSPRPSHSINAGAAWTFYDMLPERIEPRGDLSGIAPETLQRDQGYEAALYVNDEIKISPALSVSLGLR